MLNIVLFGPPGAGKGTQSEKLIERSKLIHLSTGDIFRANIKGETKLGLLAKSYIDKGQLVPDEVTINMLKDAVSKHQNPNGFIFDGFPRTVAQAKALDQIMVENETPISLMLSLEVDENELLERLLNRGKNSGRPDDQDPDKITKLFSKHFNAIAPKGVRVKVTPHHGGQGYVTPINTIAYKAASKAYETTFGKKPIPVRSGGSIPIIAMFEQELGLKTMMMGFGLDSDAIHSPNEHFGLFNYYRGIETIPYFFSNYTKLMMNENA